MDERSKTVALGALTVALIAGAGALLFWPKEPPPPPPPPPSAPPAPAPSIPAPPPVASPAPDPVEPIEAPDPDSALRKVVGAWSSAPELASWIAADGILQRVAAAVHLVTRGSSPRGVLGFVKLDGDFKVDDVVDGKSSHIYVAPASYARYDRITTIVTGIDPAVAARGYRRLAPYFDAIYAQVAAPGERFDGALKAAIARLVAVPVPEGRVELTEKGAIFLYADPALEALKPADKHLLRFGPENQRKLQGWLQMFGAAAIR